MRPEDIERCLEELDREGWSRLGRVLDDEALERFRARSDALMLGEIRFDGMFFQHDTSSGRYEDLEYGRGWIGPSLEYRKLEKLELDPELWTLIAHPTFLAIARARIGPAVSLYRAALMNKPASGGTVLPWHQDGGRLWGLDRDPALQIWTALDDAPIDGGCLEVLPGSHRGGLATPLGGLVPDAIREERARTDPRSVEPLALPARAGEALLVHNYVWHRSGRSSTGRPRRAITVCYLDAATKCVRKRKAPREFVRVL